MNDRYADSVEPSTLEPECAVSTAASLWRRGARWAGVVVLAVLVVTVLGVGTWLANQTSRIDRLGEMTPSCPSRLYGSPDELVPGQALTVEALTSLLHAARYRPAASNDALLRGSYRLVETDDGVQAVVALRPYPVRLARGFHGDGLMELEIVDNHLAVLRWQGEARVSPLPLDPPRLASFHDDALTECRPVAYQALPEHLSLAVMAAEDDAFMDHAGFSVMGIARAAWVNFRAGEVRQGGSTITQQLIKNVYLDATRTIERKLREAGLALLASQRYEKSAILEAYLNRIYWGRSGSVQLIGVSAAAEAFFDRDPEELTLDQAAMLAGMIRSPGAYDPRRHPERAKARRDWVLGRMAVLGWIDGKAHADAVARPIAARDTPMVRNRVGHLARYAASEAVERYGIDVTGTGHQLLSTVRLDEQRAAILALDEQLEILDPESDLEGAMVSVRPNDGAILAYVGGRAYAPASFDRVSQARRQVGSLFKPFVYAAAFSQGVVLPHDRVNDGPITIALANDDEWSPRNHQRNFKGIITVREALEKSLNVPAVRVALATGLDHVAAMAQAVGIDPESHYPSIALGASEFSPLEMVGAFATLAADGRRPEVHSLVKVFDRDGFAVEGRNLATPKVAVDTATVHLVNSVLQGVVRRGTAGRMHRLGLSDPIAGKTGTSNDTRDAWFAGYSPDRSTVVWVGHDDNRPTGYVGSRAAMPIFAAFAKAVRPAAGFTPFESRPRGIKHVEIDPDTGYLATEYCPRTSREEFPLEQIPLDACPLHGPSDGLWVQDATRLAAHGAHDGDLLLAGSAMPGDDVEPSTDPRQAAPDTEISLASYRYDAYGGQRD